MTYSEYWIVQCGDMSYRSIDDLPSPQRVSSSRCHVDSAFSVLSLHYSAPQPVDGVVLKPLPAAPRSAYHTRYAVLR